ncbi:MAG: Crp/Fnr family transcriptional regulator [Chloroflexi bacterium]|nr:Crp/Fnr family transcriptional regulator [Chloroflexota bacterium]
MPSKRVQTASVELARKIPPFTVLSQEEWEEIRSSLYVRRYEEGTFLFFEGDPPTALYLILEGHIALVRHSPEGRDIVLDVMRPGNMVGELAVFEGVPYSASGKALDCVQVVAIPRDKFLHLLARYPRMATAVIYDLTRRVRHLSDLVQSLVIERVEQRLARILLRLAKISGEYTDEGWAINLPLTRQDLADMAGTTVETAIRTLSRLRKEGVVDTIHGRIVIRDPERLSEIAETSE